MEYLIIYGVHKRRNHAEKYSEHATVLYTNFLDPDPLDDSSVFGPPASGSGVICKDPDPSIFQQNYSEKLLFVVFKRLNNLKYINTYSNRPTSTVDILL